jgi:hypothetical protein
MTNCMLNSIKRKNKLYKTYLTKPCKKNEIKYKRYKNKLNHTIKISKKGYGSLVRRFTSQKVHYSEGSLVRRFTSPKVHYSKTYAGFELQLCVKLGCFPVKHFSYLHIHARKNLNPLESLLST